MKKVTKSILIVFSMFLIGSFSAQAQDSDATTKMEKIKADKAGKEKELKEEKIKVSDQARKKADEAKEKQEKKQEKVKEKVEEKKSDLTKEQAERAKEAADRRADMQDKKNEINPELAKQAAEYDALKTSWMKRINAAPEGKRAALQKEMMAELVAYRTEIKKKRDDATNTGSNSISVDEGQTSTGIVSSTDKGKPIVDQDDSPNEGPTNTGQARIAATKAKLTSKQEMINDKRSLVTKAETKVAASKARLAAAKEKGNVTEAEIAAKEAQIARAESLISKLEASLSNGTNVLKEQKAKLTPTVNKN